MPQVLFIDFETRSPLDLRTAGLDNYARHPDTQIICMALAFDNEEPCVLDLRTGPGLLKSNEKTFKRVLRHVHAGGEVVAHNAAFEIAIWTRLIEPTINVALLPEQCICTMAAALAMALPGSLEGAGAALGIEQPKDRAGHALMLKMCRPHPGGWWEPPEDVQRLMDYCAQDVRAEREIFYRVLPLSKQERAVWLLDREINDRGIFVDLPSVRKAAAMAEAQKKRLDDELSILTTGEVQTSNAVGALKPWLADYGVMADSLDKASVAQLLSSTDGVVHRALSIRQEAGKSSVAKLSAFIELAGPDNRLRNSMQYHGAATGRWAGRGVQLQNLPRPHLEQADIGDVIGMINADEAVLIDMLHGSVLGAISSCLRGMLCAAPGKTLFGGDFSGIEARGLAWAAGDEDVLDVFRSGGDIYCREATAVYGREITKANKLERLVGKVLVLALGYGGGIGAMGTMAKAYGLDLDPVYTMLKPTFTDDELDRALFSYAFYLTRAATPLGRDSAIVADILKQRWRAKRPATVMYWGDVEKAALAAVSAPGERFRAGPKGREVEFLVKGSFLWCRLPSGRVLCYPYPTREPDKAGGAILRYKTVNSTSRAWGYTATYGGKLVENIIQAIARDLLALAMLRFADAGEDIVMHVHDEIVAEGRYTDADLSRLMSLMAEVPIWAAGFPIEVEGWIGQRYRK